MKMAHDVNVESISHDIDEEVRRSIISFLQTYDFPYVTIVLDKNKLRQIFMEHFTNRRSLDWLKDGINSVAHKKIGVATVAMTETNRVHTAGLANLLLSKGILTCKTVHSYGRKGMSVECRRNLEGKMLDVGEILKNTFPSRLVDLDRKDVPMIPQHMNCRHVMSA